MATLLGHEINIIGGNINTYGATGEFETDRSTWGFSDDTTYWTATRTPTYKVTGSWGCQIAVTGIKTPVRTLLIPANFNAVNGKKYVISIMCFIPSGSPYSNVGTLRLFYDTGWNFVAQSTYQLTSAKSGWITIHLMIERTGATQNNSKVWLGIDDVTQTNGASGNIFADVFWVREYEDIVAVCTLAIDTPNCIVTDETSTDADDGTITMATTGGTAPLSYSKDNVNWQSSNQFTGLAPGVYTIYVKDSATTPCTAQQAFSVNAAAIAFEFDATITDESVSGAEDGQIEITVTGTGGPFTYSNDGGSNYQGSNVFSNLAPGNYLLVVKDASDNTLSLLVTVQPGTVSFDEAYFSKNEIPVTRYASANVAEDNYRIMLDVRINESGTYNSVMKVAMPPALMEVNQPVTFNIRPAFRGVLSATPPEHNAGLLLKLTDRAKLFKVYYGDIFDQMQEPSAWSGLPVNLVLLGGISKYQFPSIDYLYAYMQANKKFLTWAPLTKYVDYEQEDYLLFWVYDADISTCKLMLTAYFDDDTNETATITTINTAYGDLLQVPAGPLNSGAIGIDPEKNLVYYELWIADQADVVVSEVRSYYITEFTSSRTRYYLFLNSLGSYEVLRTVGFSEDSVDTDREVSEQILPIGYESLQGQFAAGNAENRITTRVSTGFFAGPDSQQWLDYMQEVMLSSRIYDITSGDRVPVINITKKLVIRQNEDNKRFARFDFVNAYADHSYTPLGL